jgi:hypothetical protein
MLANPLLSPRSLVINYTKSNQVEGRGKEIVVGEGRGATHYNWRPDVWALVTYIQYWYSTAANTYYDHPTGWWLDDVSVDFWSPWGRGSPIDPYVGDAIWNDVFYDPNPPWIRWVIWRGWMWDWTGTWTWYPDIDPWDPHFDHVHFTFW